MFIKGRFTALLYLGTLHWKNDAQALVKKTKEIFGGGGGRGLVRPKIHFRLLKRYFKLLWSPEIDSKESIPPAYEA
jgi:hypothetical protein